MPRARAVLINRDYARLWYGQAVSLVGTYVFDTTLVLWIATGIARDRTWAPAAVSGVLVTAGAAVFLVGPVAGVFVDRWDRIRTMLGTEVVRGVLVLGLAVLSFLPLDALPTFVWLALAYTVVFVVNAAAMFFSPARFAVIGQVVRGEADRARAAGITQATMATASIVGPPLAAPLLFTVGVQWAMLLNAASYAVSYLAIRSVRTAAGPVASVPSTPTVRSGRSGRVGLVGEFLAGLRFFRRSRFLVALLTVAVIAASGTGALAALDVFFVTENLHTAPRLYGVLSMGFGIGAVVGALASGRIVGRIGARTTTWLGLVVAGVLVVAYARQDSFWSAVALYVAVAVPVAALNTALSPLLLAAAPQEYLGRVMSVFNPANQLASMVSTVAAGWLASTVLRGFHADLAGLRLGRIDTIFAVAGVLIVASGLYARAALPHDAARPAAAGAEPAAEPG